MENLTKGYESTYDCKRQVLFHKFRHLIFHKKRQIKFHTYLAFNTHGALSVGLLFIDFV